MNENGKFNPDNVIVAPGVTNGAHHMHDYVGNQANDAFASDEDLANGDTTCQNQGDKSTTTGRCCACRTARTRTTRTPRRRQGRQRRRDPARPPQVTLKFVGNPRGKVIAMPRFLRIITGDAKAFTNGDANANASWSCTGFEDRQLKDKYPICPEGSQVVRTFKFQSCWDGQNIDSANHRTHVAFADAERQLRRTASRPSRSWCSASSTTCRPSSDGQTRLFAVDSFPEQLHKPITDHGDFINVFDENLMKRGGRLHQQRPEVPVIRCTRTGERPPGGGPFLRRLRPSP